MKLQKYEVKEGLDSENAKLAARALNSLELLYSADSYYGWYV